MTLTHKQRAILDLIVAGKSGPEIQKALKITRVDYGQAIHRAKRANGFKTTYQLVVAFAGGK